MACKRTWLNKRYLTRVSCSCGKTWDKRIDSLKEWNGKCRTCANRETARNDVRRGERARAQILRQGGIPNARKFDGRNNAGPNSPRWKGGITPENQRLRGSELYARWRIAVFRRDEFKCRVCGRTGGKLQAHHLKSWALHPELRFSVDNGVTAHKHCHKEVLHEGNFHNVA